LESFQEFFAAFQSKCSTLPRPVTIEVVLAGGVVDLTFVDITGSSTAFEKFQEAFPKSRDRSAKTYNYPDFLFHQATNFTQPLTLENPTVCTLRVYGKSLSHRSKLSLPVRNTLTVNLKVPEDELVILIRFYSDFYTR